MKCKFALSLVIALCAAGNALAQANPLDVLKSNAPFEDKMEACRVLSHTATVDAVPVLKPLLLDEQLSHPARYVLEPMQCPEAGEALRDALGKTNGRLKVGIISSLEVRRDGQAVPALIPLLADADGQVAQAAAGALGKIATPDAVKALGDAVAKADAGSRNFAAFCDALMDVAEIFAAKQQGDQAAAIYDRLSGIDKAPAQVRAAALRGAVLARGPKDGLPALIKALHSEDGAIFAASLRTVRELKGGNELSAALAGEIAGIQADRQVQLIQTLADCGGDGAGPALLALAKDAPVETRTAAILALARLGYAPVLDVAKGLIVSEDAELAEAARTAVSYFAGAKDDVLMAMLVEQDARMRQAAVEMIGEGGIPKPGEVLMKAATSDADEKVRIAALNGMKEYATEKDVPALLERMNKAASRGEIDAAEKTLEVFCKRRQQVGPQNVSIQKAVYGNIPDGPAADVTAKVVGMLEAGQLAVNASNVNFGDAAPGVVKKLKINYTQNDTTASATVNEGETINLAACSVPDGIVDTFCKSLGTVQGDSKLATLQLLRAAGTSEALDAVKAAMSGDGAVKDAAVRLLCDWPNPGALPDVMELAKAAQDQTMKTLAVRGALRMLAMKPATPDVMAQYAAIMQGAAGADEKKAVLGSLARVQSADALALAMNLIADESVKTEAVQAAVSIATALGKAAREDATIFNGKDLTGWTGDPKYWRFQDGAFVGQSDGKLEKNNFLWSGVEVGDFYLAIDIKLEPQTGNGGVQFRSKKFDESGLAIGYQFDVGKDVWGRLYHERGRGKLDWTDRAEKAVKPGDWNHCEILAVGPAIWTSVNGQLGIACLEPNGERSGLLALQLHVGPPETVQYRVKKLVHNPPIQMESMTAEMLLKELKPVAAQ
jgi:HEAT repeat protein